MRSALAIEGGADRPAAIRGPQLRSDRLYQDGAVQLAAACPGRAAEESNPAACLHGAAEEQESQVMEPSPGAGATPDVKQEPSLLVTSGPEADLAGLRVAAEGLEREAKWFDLHHAYPTWQNAADPDHEFITYVQRPALATLSFKGGGFRRGELDELLADDPRQFFRGTCGRSHHPDVIAL
jgi:hypothetical protein